MRIFTLFIVALFASTPVQAADDRPKAGMDALMDMSDEEFDEMLKESIRRQEEENGYTIEERTKAMFQARAELTRAEIVNVQEYVIRKQMENVPDEHRMDFLNGSLSDLAQCTAFRLAQAHSLKQRGGTNADTYEKKANLFESHLYLAAQAVGRIVGDDTYEAEARRQVKDNATAWVSTHYDSMTYKTDGQKQHYDGWDGKCTKISNVLTDQLEQRAGERVSAAAVEKRTDEILADLVASRQ